MNYPDVLSSEFTEMDLVKPIPRKIVLALDARQPSPLSQCGAG
jgi:hypothetical protein